MEILKLLLYITKREEVEKSGGTLFINEFANYLRDYSILKKFQHFKKLAGCEGQINSKLSFFDKKIDYFCCCRTFMMVLTKKNYPINRQYKRIYSETRISDPRIENIKLLFRQDFDRGIGLMFRYYLAVCKLLCIKQTNEMKFYFEKFVYFRKYQEELCIPEYEVCFFLAFYNLHKEVDADFEGVYLNLYKLFHPYDTSNVNSKISYSSNRNDALMGCLIKLTSLNQASMLQTLYIISTDCGFLIDIRYQTISYNFKKSFESEEIRMSFLHYIDSIVELKKKKSKEEVARLIFLDKI